MPGTVSKIRFLVSSKDNLRFNGFQFFSSSRKFPVSQYNVAATIINLMILNIY